MCFCYFTTFLIRLCAIVTAQFHVRTSSKITVIAAHAFGSLYFSCFSSKLLLYLKTSSRDQQDGRRYGLKYRDLVIALFDENLWGFKPPLIASSEWTYSITLSILPSLSSPPPSPSTTKLCTANFLLNTDCMD